jgi:hypothetical protein
MRKRLACTGLAAVAAMLVGAPSALAAGGPAVGVDAGTIGATTPGDGFRYVTAPTLGVPAGAPRGRPVQRTLVMRIARDGGRVRNYRYLRGSFTVPSVAYDFSTTGLSADSSTLVLARPRFRFGQASSIFAVLDAKSLAPRQAVRLKGDFGLDGISPDGSHIYLIHYLSGPTHYEVRSFDLLGNRLDPKPIVDPREPDEKMQGLPVTRTTSPDGRWAYTLYAGNGGTPFVHALDTQAGTAACVDLDALRGLRNPMLLGLDAGGSAGPLTVTGRHGQPLALVDTQTFEVSAPGEGDGGGGPPWVLLLLAGIGGLAAAILLGATGRRRPATT